jgi:hypothetical protein
VDISPVVPSRQEVFGFQVYASSVQGIPANRPRLDVQARMFCFNHKAHTAPQPIEALSLQPAHLDAREHSSHHSPRLAITAKIALCLLLCPAILSCFNTCSARFANPSSRPAWKESIEIIGARVPTNRVLTSPTSSLDAGRCVSMRVDACRCRVEMPSQRLHTGRALPQ